MHKECYGNDDHSAIDMFCTFSYDDIIDSTNKITEYLDDVWRYATKLKWADPPGDLRFPGDSMPSMDVNDIMVCSNTFGETIDLFRIEITLKPDEREYTLDAKILIDPDEFEYLIDELAIDPSTHSICAYDETREDLKSMVVIKHFLDQLVLHLKPMFGLMRTSRVLREYDWLSRDQKISLMTNKKGGKINGKEED